jgi:hypothetical protein
MSPRIDNLNMKNIKHATLNEQVRALLAYVTGMAEVASLKFGWTIVCSNCFLLSSLYTSGQKLVITLKYTAVSTSNSLHFGITLKNSASSIFLKLQNCLF